MKFALNTDFLSHEVKGEASPSRLAQPRAMSLS